MTFRRWIFLAAFAMTLGAQAAEDPHLTFKRAAALMEAGKSAEAIPLFQAVLAAMPDDDPALWNLGLAAADAGNFQLALDTWLHYRKLAPQDPQGMGKVIQAYQGLNKLADRDREREALFAFRRTLPAEDIASYEKYCRDQFRVQGKKVQVYEYFDPQGEWRIFYRFSVMDAAGKEQMFYSLGSYDATTRVSRETHQIPVDGRIYHLDRYEDQGKTHFTYAFTDSKPDYDTVRRWVIDIMSGKVRPVSSTKASPDSKGVKVEIYENKP